MNTDVLIDMRALVILGLAMVVSGCRSGSIYQAGALPPEFSAPHFANMQTIDLSRLAQSVADTDLLYPGDVVTISVTTGLETTEPIRWKGRIADDGTANVPLVGPVPIAGLRLPHAEDTIRVESIRRGKFINPNVTILIENRRSNSVTVVGAVEEPGVYQLPVGNSNVIAAITKAKGLTKDADTTIEIRHPPLAGYAGADMNAPGNNGLSTELAGFRRGQGFAGMPSRTLRLDLKEAAAMDNVDTHLEDGSTVMVMPRPKRYIHVMGLVRKPDQFEMPPDHELRLLDAIALANGRTLELADKVRVIRTLPDRPEPIVIEASVMQAKRNTASNIRLAPGDVVTVEETPTTFVVGTIREFVRFGFTAGIPGI